MNLDQADQGNQMKPERIQITRELATKFFDMLVLRNGTNELYRESFIAWAGSGIGHEFRIGGQLGRGGKFKILRHENPLDMFYVDGYPEDMTSRIKEIQNEINEMITKITDEQFPPESGPGKMKILILPKLTKDQKDEILENIYNGLMTEAFRRWHDRGDFDSHVSGDLPPVSKKKILKDISEFFKI